MTTAHPIFLVRRYMEKVESGHYRDIGKQAADAYRTRLTQVDPYERLGQLVATKVRLADKVTLINSLVGWATGLDGQLSDEGALSILVGWATAEGTRWVDRPTIHPRRNVDLDNLIEEPDVPVDV
jgi:hypothetical protein